ncbi:SDR family NAD(P)-dependent oxidoreductase [Mycobacterium antarcticum]|uniref:SDR family NAD(P)-dependent oxidoreductase n=1 Tax=Mycolicibacterium sp. TUM20984 TaxID=3023368 RepID=UPI00238880F0|nr:SDR family oxidoreductase [Mycolicibacterium sp. TUM20984]GLP83024.1 short-chain dehydrogenase [Mycolicibacterium sp. TUM20984]
MQRNWADRHVLVTGAAGVIGGAVTRTLQALGAAVTQVDRAPQRDMSYCDVTDPEDVERVVEVAHSSRPLTDCVHAAGLLLVGDIVSTDLEDIRSVVNVNLISNFVLAQAIVPRLSNGSTFTVVASQAAFRGAAHWAAYCASKAGAVSFTQSLAHEVGPRGIRVNAVCPGSVDSPMMARSIDVLADLDGVGRSDVLKRYVDSIPLGRLATPQDVADCCALFMEDRARFISGATVAVDGGEG